MKAWLKYADPRTSLLPDRLPELKPEDKSRRYTPHNSGADLYPYLILTAHLTDPALYRGTLLEMLRNEVRYTTRTDSVPANLDLNTGELGPMSLFGAGEYAKDGLLAVTELLGRTPWFYRMVDMTADVMKNAPVASGLGTSRFRQRAQWRSPPDDRATGSDDWRSALHGLGQAHRRCLCRGSAASQ
jgi:hypothetical protein